MMLRNIVSAALLCTPLMTHAQQLERPTTGWVRVASQVVAHCKIPARLAVHVHELEGYFSFISDLVGTRIPRKTVFRIYFSEFGREKEQCPDLVTLQKLWTTQTHLSIPASGPNESVDEPHLDGVAYLGTPYIQVRPDIFGAREAPMPETRQAYASFYAYPDAEDVYQFERMYGHGFYVIGHELMHHLLLMKGIPMMDHHCVMVYQRYNVKMLQYLLAHNLANGSYLTYWREWLKPKEFQLCTGMLALR